MYYDCTRSFYTLFLIFLICLHLYYKYKKLFDICLTLVENFCLFYYLVENFCYFSLFNICQSLSRINPSAYSFNSLGIHSK